MMTLPTEILFNSEWFVIAGELLYILIYSHAY